MCDFGTDYGICPRTYRPVEISRLSFSDGTISSPPISTAIPSYALDWQHCCGQISDQNFADVGSQPMNCLCPKFNFCHVRLEAHEQYF